MKTCRKNPSNKAYTCAEVSRPVTRDAPVSRKVSTTIEFSLPKHLQSPWEMWLNMEAPATIEFSLPSSKSLAREMPQWAELFLARDKTSLLCKCEKPKEVTCDRRYKTISAKM